MPNLDTYRKQAKQFIRWHRERNYSIGEKIRLLERFRHLTDLEALDAPLPLAVAQESRGGGRVPELVGIKSVSDRRQSGAETG